MNVEELINQIKKRPEMYVGCRELEAVRHFVDGFILNNFLTGRTDSVEKEFRERFHDWTKERIEKRYQVELETNRDYVFYIIKVSQDSVDGLNIFFELCCEFFEEIHRKNGK